MIEGRMSRETLQYLKSMIKNIKTNQHEKGIMKLNIQKILDNKYSK